MGVRETGWSSMVIQPLTSGQVGSQIFGSCHILAAHSNVGDEVAGVTPTDTIYRAALLPVKVCAEVD